MGKYGTTENAVMHLPSHTARAPQLNSFWLILITPCIYKMNRCFKAYWFQILGKTSWYFLVIKNILILKKKDYGNNKIQVVTAILLGLQIEDKLEKSTLNITHETVVRCYPHNSPNWDYYITRQQCYEHTVCSNVLFKKKNFPFTFLKTQHDCSIYLLRIDKIISVSCKTVYRWVMTNWYFISSTVSPNSISIICN